MSVEACCTCAALLSSLPCEEKSEKQNGDNIRRLECCNRVICARCLTKNPRFSTYCPFCQVSIVPSSLPQGLRDPPEYSPPVGGMHTTCDGQPPPYSVQNPSTLPPEKAIKHNEAQDVLHFVDPNNDSITSLSLSYGVPAEILRRTNGLFADHLLAARRTLLIPAEYYKGGVSLSPRPLEGEEEEIRKGKVRKFMVGCKVAEYDVALLYLQQAEYDLEQAMEAFKADERWEREHPLDIEGKGRRKGKEKSQSSFIGRIFS